jgi:hypothetical protein
MIRKQNDQMEGVRRNLSGSLSKPEPSKPEPSKPEPSKPEPSKPEPSKPEPSEVGFEASGNLPVTYHVTGNIRYLTQIVKTGTFRSGSYIEVNGSLKVDEWMGHGLMGH